MDFSKIKTKDSVTRVNLDFLVDEKKQNASTIEYVELLWSLSSVMQSLTDTCVSKTREFGKSVLEVFEEDYDRVIAPVKRRIPSNAQDRNTYEKLTCGHLVSRTLGLFHYNHIDPIPLSLIAAKCMMQAFDDFDATHYRKSAYLFQHASHLLSKDKDKSKDMRRFACIAFAYEHYLVECEYERALSYIKKAIDLGWERDNELIEAVTFAKQHTLQILESEDDPRDKEEYIVGIASLCIPPTHHTFIL